MFLRPTLVSLLFWLAAAQLLVLPTWAQEETGSSVPLSSAWNIASSGKASSSGELVFRVTPADGEDPVEVSVFVLSGANETGVASSIRRALSTQLDAQRFDIQAGQGANVLVTTDPAAGRSPSGFALELVTSDVENVRVMVQSAAPVAPPTVPPQSLPADPATPASPALPNAPGDATPQSPESPSPAAPAPRSPGSPAPATPTPEGPPAGSPATPAPAPAPSGSPAVPPPQSSPPGSPAAPPPGGPPASSPTQPPPGGPPASAPAAPPPGAANSSANGGAGAPASAPPPPSGASPGS